MKLCLKFNKMKCLRGVTVFLLCSLQPVWHSVDFLKKYNLFEWRKKRGTVNDIPTFTCSPENMRNKTITEAIYSWFTFVFWSCKVANYASMCQSWIHHHCPSYWLLYVTMTPWLVKLQSSCLKQETGVLIQLYRSAIFVTAINQFNALFAFLKVKS
jgi:hypothetical protein